MTLKNALFDLSIVVIDVIIVLSHKYQYQIL